MRIQQRKRRTVTQILKAPAVRMAPMFQNMRVTRIIVLRLQRFKDLARKTMMSTMKNIKITNVARSLSLLPVRHTMRLPVPEILAEGGDPQELPHTH
jgi:hypothetical protein